MALVTIGIVSYNTRDLTCRCIESVTAAAVKTESRIVLADNGSSDNTLETVVSLYPNVTVLSLPDNPGYGAALNRIITHCPSPFFLALNADVVLESGSLDKLISVMENDPNCVLAGPGLRSPQGALQRSCKHFPSLSGIAIDLFGLDSFFLFNRWIRRFYYDDPTGADLLPVDTVSGSVMLIRLDAFREISGFDERFQLYFEEDDLCYRLQQAGKKVFFVPDATAVHVHAASTVQSLQRQTTYYLSAAFYARKHFQPIAAFFVYFSIYLSMLLRPAAFLIKYFPFNPARARLLSFKWKACCLVIVDLTKFLFLIKRADPR